MTISTMMLFFKFFFFFYEFSVFNFNKNFNFNFAKICNFPKNKSIFCIKKLITSASSLANSSLSSFLSTDIQATKKNLFYVQTNGLGILRRGSEYISSLFFNFYYGLADTFQKQFEIIMILGIVFLILAIGILIPIVFSVHRTNNRVLSLFGTIPLIEIRELALKCEKYISNFLEDKNDKKDESEEGEGEEEGKEGEEDKSIFLFFSYPLILFLILLKF